MNNQNLIISAIVAIVFGGMGFFAGTKYQQDQTLQFSLLGQNGQRSFRDQGAMGGVIGKNSPEAGMMRQGGTNGQGFGFRPLGGEIIASDDKSITVKLSDGTSKIIMLSTTSTINKAVDGTIADLKVGENVRIFGNTNTDGSVTATNIQLVQEPMGTQMQKVNQ